jgi:hypothetical protein
MSTVGTTEYLASLRTVIAPLEAIHQRITNARAEEEGLAQKLVGLHGRQREREEAATSPTRRRHIENATTWEDGALDEKTALADVIKPAAVHAANLLAPAIEAKLGKITEALIPFSDTVQRAGVIAKTTDAYHAAQQVVDRLRDQNQTYHHRDVAISLLLQRARFVEAILAEALKELPDFSQFVARRPSDPNPVAGAKRA